MTIVPQRDWDFERPLVLVGFPTPGMVGAVAASYLIPTLGMRLVATMESPHLPPVASIRKGRAIAPVQIFASQTRCFDERCSQLVIVRSDAAPDPEHVNDIATELLDWCTSVGAGLIVALEGTSVEGSDGAVFAVPNVAADLDVERLRVHTLPEGIVGGFAASLLIQGNRRGAGVLCLFTSTADGVPDAAAAARLVEVTSSLVPGISLDAGPLEQKAERIEAGLRRFAEEFEAAIGKSEQGSSMMYG